MKLVYLIPNLSSAGGTIRVLHNKICWFICNGGYEITIITTDQRGNPAYYDFPNQVQIIDLGINYCSAYNKPPISRLISIHRKKRIHIHKLSLTLSRIKPDIIITIYPSDTIRIPQIDGVTSLVEIHGNRYFRLAQGYKGLHKIIAIYRTWKDFLFIKSFDRIIVLTNEGAKQWGKCSNIDVIPNAITNHPEVSLNLNAKRVIAVGRLEYEKGIDRLIKAWALLPKDILLEWKLTIFGRGSQYVYLNKLIDSLGLNSSVIILPPTKNIFNEYANSAFLAMSSHTEGMPMVMIEAMSCGLPIISFDCSCGPKEIIDDGENGFLIEDDNIEAFALRMEELIRNKSLRHNFSKNAKLVKGKFSEKRIMEMWQKYFSEIISSKANKP